MNEFNTLENVKRLFENLNLTGTQNSYFIAYKDMNKQMGINGGALGGVVSGMEYPYDAVLVNRTEKGIAMILLVTDGVVWNMVKLDKLRLKDNEYIFIDNNEIQKVEIKKFALLNSSKKKISIKTNDKTYYLYANVNEPQLPYHDEGFDKFMKEFIK